MGETTSKQPHSINFGGKNLKIYLIPKIQGGNDLKMTSKQPHSMNLGGKHLTMYFIPQIWEDRTWSEALRKTPEEEHSTASTLLGADITQTIRHCFTSKPTQIHSSSPVLRGTRGVFPLP